MFLKNLIKHNSSLIESCFYLAKHNLIDPNSYLIDLDALYENMQNTIKEAKKYNIELFFAPKHVGNNPFIAQKAIEFGFKGIMPVDFAEADIMLNNNVKISHLGHLVQCPYNKLEKFMKNNVEIITIFSLEKAKQINSIAKKLNIIQDVMLKPLNILRDNIYPQQEGGVELQEFDNFVKKLKKLPHIKINGLTSFPCFLFNDEERKIKPTHNIKTIHQANEILKANNINVKQINLPSATCIANIKNIKEQGGNYGESGNGITGTTPLHSIENNKELEKPAMLYYSNVSHNVGNSSYIYGGGYYFRSNCSNFLTQDYKMHSLVKPSNINIDYYMELKSKLQIETPVIGCFRAQIFATRAKVILLEGVSKNKPKIKHIYSPNGYLIK